MFNFSWIPGFQFSIKKILSAVNILLASTIAWQAGKSGAFYLGNTYLKTPSAENVRFIPPAKPKRNKARKFSEFQAIIDQNVFNVKVREEVIAEEKPVEPVIKKVDITAELKNIIDSLELKGSLIFGEQNYCILWSKPKRKQKMFAKGDVIFDTSAQVYKVEDHAVYIQLGKEVGVLKYKGLVSDEEMKARLQGKTEESQKKQAKKLTKTKKKKKISKGNQTEFSFKSSEIDSALNNFSKLLMQARVDPAIRNGRQIGFRIRAIDRGSLYEKLGLKNNDIIKRINGNGLDSPEKAISLLKILRNEREITVELERKGSPLSLNYHIN